MNLILITINSVLKVNKTNSIHNFEIYRNKYIIYPTRIPSSISVGATESARSTTNLANCLTLIIYLGSSESALIIFVHLAT